MPRKRTGTIERRPDGSLRARVTVTTELGARRIWFKLRPEFTDEKARAVGAALSDRFARITLTALDAELLAGKAARNVDSLEPLAPPESPGVYAVMGATASVKIGRAKNIAKRMREMQTSQPAPLRLLAVLSRNPSDERKFHKRLGAHRTHGEWFTLGAAVVECLLEARGESDG